MSKNLENVKTLLSRALNAAMASAHHSTVKEATSHIKQAISKIDQATNAQHKRKSGSQFESWWGNIQAGTAGQAMAPMSAEVQQKTLAELNALISKEQAKLQALQKMSDSVPDQLLQD